MIEWILVVVGEFLIQVVAEALIELGFHSLAEPFKKTPNSWLASMGFALCGAVVGGLSLLAFPNNLVSQSWRLINLLITPLAVGGFMALLGAWRVKRGQPMLRIDRFSYGYLFALALACIRYLFAA